MDELKEIIRQLKKDVKEINQVQKESKCDIEELKRELIGAKLEQKIYKEDIEELKLENKNLLEKMSRMESTNTELKRRLETFDNESRNNKVVTSGIPIVTDDNLLPKHTASKMKSTNEFKYGLEKFGKEPQKNRVVMAEVPTDTEDTILKDIVGNIESAITKFIYRPEKLDKESKKIKVVMGRPVGFKETIIPKDAASKIESSNTELKHILETLDKETRQNSIVMTAPPIETDDSTLLKDAEGKTMKQHPKIDGTPTVVPANPFNPRDDAEVLRKAMKGFGTDDKAIINVLSKRSNAQRLQISVEFKTLYGKDLIKDLKSETSGKFEDLIVALMTPLPQFYAKELRDAIVGLGTDEEVLIEVLCTKSNNEIKTIRHAYSSMYNKSLEDDLKGDTSGTFKRLMVSLCNACRDESMVTNQAQAAEDARTLLRAGELRFGTDESTFNMILCQRNFAQLRLIFEEYYKITGHDFEQAIKNEFSGSSKDGMLAIVRSIRNLPGFFAKCLQNAIAGLGTNDKTLIRVVATRCEIDMGNIKQNYLAQYGETLADAIKGDTSGDYKKLLLALIGES